MREVFCQLPFSGKKQCLFQETCIWSVFVVIEIIYAKCYRVPFLRNSTGNYLVSNQTVSKYFEEISLFIQCVLAVNVNWSKPTAMCIFSFLLLPVTNAIWWCFCLIAKVKCCVLIGSALSLQSPSNTTFEDFIVSVFFHKVSLSACSPPSLSQAFWCVEETLCSVEF